MLNSIFAAKKLFLQLLSDTCLCKLTKFQLASLYTEDAFRVDGQLAVDNDNNATCEHMLAKLDLSRARTELGKRQS